MRILTQEEQTQAINYIKFKLKEDKWPFYDEIGLVNLLQVSLNDKDLAVYEGLRDKSRVDSMKIPGGLEKPSNRDYWLSLAEEQKQRIIAAIKAGSYDDIKSEMESLGLLATFSSKSSGGVRILNRMDAI